MKYWKHRLSNNTEAQFTQTRKKSVRLKLTLQILTGLSLKTSSCSSCFITWLHSAKLRRNLMRSQVVFEPGCLKPAELTRLYNLPYIPLALISLVTFSPYCRPWADMGDSVVAGKCALSKDTNQRQMGKPLGDLLPLVLWRVSIACFAVLKKSPRNIVPLSNDYWKIPPPHQLWNKEGSSWEAAYACSPFCEILNLSFLTHSLRAGRHPRNTSHIFVRGSVHAVLTSGLWWELHEIAEEKCTYRWRVDTLDKETTSLPCQNPTGSRSSQNVVHLSMDPNMLGCALFTPELSSFHSKKLLSSFLPCQILPDHNSLTPKVFAQTIFDDLQ